MTPAHDIASKANGPGILGNAASVRLVWLFAIFVILTTALKVVVIANLDLFWDEAYYWQASKRLAVGYADKPFMNALLVWIGTGIFGDTPLGVRFMHLVFSAILPIAVFWTGRPVVGFRDALCAGALVLLIPVGSLQGLQAQPEVVMAVLAVLALGAFERATRIGSARWWILFGLLCGLGAATHYRFAPLVLGIFLYMVLTPAGRALWTRRGFWLAVLVGLPGLVPLAWFNLNSDFASFRYQIIDRNPWAFQWTAALKYWIGQILALNPLIFSACAMAFACLVRRWRRGEDRMALLGSVTIAYIGGYFLLSPWTDQNHFNVHWPVIGYAPLTLLLPDIMRQAWGYGAGAWQRSLAKLFAAGIPASGALMGLGVLLFLAANIWPQALMPTLVERASRLSIQGWSALAREAGSHYAVLKKQTLAAGLPAPALVAPDYIVASELDFALKKMGVPTAFTLDHTINVNDGLQVQYGLWGLGQKSLIRGHAGHRALVLYEVPHYEFHNPRRLARRGLLCNALQDLEFAGEFVMPGGARHFQFFRATVRPAARAQSITGTVPPAPLDCGVMPPVYITRPKQGGTYGRKNDTISGWVRQNGAKVESVAALIDGKVIGEARPAGDVGPSLPGFGPYREPGVTYQGFSISWQPARLPAGRHNLHIAVRLADGTERVMARHVIYIPGFLR